MANEPERPIEKLLRACAKRRRDEASQGAGFELHPATRRLLQGEVARRFARRDSARSGASRWWGASFWPRLAEACLLVALMAVVGYLLVPALRPSKNALQLAQTHTRELDGSQAKPGPAPAAQASVAANEDSKLDADRKRAAAVDSLALQKKAPASPPSGNRSNADKDSLAMAEPATSNARRAPASALAQKELKLESAPANAPAAMAESPAVAAPAPTERVPGVAGTAVAPATPPEGKAMGLARNEKEVGNVSNSIGGGGGGFGFANKALPANGGSNSATLLSDSSRATNAVAASFQAGAVGDAAGMLTQNFAHDAAKAAKDASELVWRQRFAQVPLEKAKVAQSQAGPSILTSFQVQQTGPELRVIDSDGSVYTGSVQLATSPLRKSNGVAAFGAAPASPQSPMRSVLATDMPTSAQMPVRFFRVTGTNRSLNQPVVFSGDLTSLTNGVLSGSSNVTLSGRVSGDKSAAGVLLNTRISGQAVIGKDKVIPVNAVPAP